PQESAKTLGMTANCSGVRHVRMRILGIALLAAFALSAVGAGSALAKDKYGVNTWQQYKHCPLKYEGITDCFTGITNGGAQGGYFQYGTVLTRLNKSITIQGGFKGEENFIEVAAPEDGANLLESPAEPIVTGLKVITPKIQEQANWPEALKASFAEAVANKETKAFATIESAGNECTTVPGCIDTESLLFPTESPPAFRLALKVKVTAPWLEKLGGGPCMIGSDENPIKQNLVTAGAGNVGTSVTFNKLFTNTLVANSRLVDVKWHISKEQGAKGCGGSEYEAYVDKALNLALEVEFPAGGEVTGRRGVTVLTGNLHDGNSEAVGPALEEGAK
ncbi:MAG: hypothetical protein ACHQHO_08545, partial [Solirubrobacterales bacterium]